MNPVDQSSRRRFRPIGGRGSLLLLSVALTGLVGCADGLGTRRQGDPLVGIHAQPVPVAPSNAGNGVQTVAGPVPSLPASYTAPGPAAIASGETTTPTDPHHLAITTDTVPTAQPIAGTVRGAPPGGVTVGDPVPATNDSTSRGAPPASTLQQLGASSPTGATAAITTFEEAQQFLTKQGVTWQRFDMEERQWKFECGIPNPSNRIFDRHFKTERAFPDPLSAMRAIIAEIEKRSD